MSNETNILNDHHVKEHPEYKDYYFAKCGKIISTRRGRVKEVKPWHTPKGYRRIDLYNDDGKRTVRVAREMLKVWVGKPAGLFDTADHINHKRDDDRLDNLRWLDLSTNVRRQFYR